MRCGPSIQLAGEALPPDFSRWRHWGQPLLETLAMSVAGTAIGGAVAIVLSVLVARLHGAGFRFLALV